MVDYSLDSFESYANSILSVFDIACDNIKIDLNRELLNEKIEPVTKYAEYAEFYDNKKNEELCKFSSLYIFSTYDTILEYMNEICKTNKSLYDEYHILFARLLVDIHHFKESSLFRERVEKMEKLSKSLIKELQERI